MANIAKWNAPSSVVTVLSTELNSLGSNTLSAASSAIANQTNLDIYSDWELVLASLSPAAGAFISVYILEAIDGTNYPEATNLRLKSSQLLFTIGLDTTAATAQRIAVRNVVIPPGTFKIVIDNQSGVSLNASGNTLKMQAYDANLNA